MSDAGAAPLPDPGPATARRDAYTAFVAGDLAKPAGGESCRDVLGTVDRLVVEIAGWSDARLVAAVTDSARRQRYQAVSWQHAELPLSAVAVWPRMGGLSGAATGGSALDTAAHLRRHGVPPQATRLAALLRQVEVDPAGALAVSRALPLLVLPYALIAGRPHDRLAWMLDDGSHRAVLLAMQAPDVAVRVLLGNRGAGDAPR